MRKSIIASVLVLGSMLAAPSAMAFDSDWRVKGAAFSVDGDDTAALNAGIVYGIDFLGMIGAEFEANTSIADGEFPGGTEYSATQLGGYATLTTPGPIYFKAKAGLAYHDVEVGTLSDTDSAPAYGIGLGLFGFELEYTRTEFQETDVDMLSLSFGF
ncbi:MAG: hypothetical protein R3270_10170 [Gammaproteobacteria bacterium]|nr:hypothetical protein [Gammaproteobacteria bacterium]